MAHSLQHIATQEAIKQRRRHRVGGWSGRYYILACHWAHSVVIDRTTVYGKHASIKEHQNEGAERFKW
jgi:hypothetical protein